MKSIEQIKEDILKLDESWNADDIIEAFGDFQENGEDSVYVGKSDNAGYDYIAYIDTEDSIQFCICVNDDNKITDVWIA